MSVILVPSDTRPDTMDLPVQIAKIMDVEVVVPPQGVLPYFSEAGDIKELHNWINDTVKNASPDALIVSLETLTLGGVIPARMVSTNESEALANLNLLEDLHKNYPNLKIYVHGVIVRNPDNDPYQEKPEVAKNYNTLVQYGILRDKVICGDRDSENEMNKIGKSLPKNVLNDYLALRKRNINIHLRAIDYLEKGIITYLALSLDNTKAGGFPAIDRRVLENKLNETDLWEKANIGPGSDEVSCELMAKFALDLSEPQDKRKVFVLYNATRGPEAEMLYEDRPLKGIIDAHKRIIGMNETEDIRKADVILAVNAPGVRQAESITQPNYKDVENAGRNLPDFIDCINEALAARKSVVIADVAYANGCDKRFMDLLSYSCDLTKLAGFAGWDTAANSIGSALAMGIASLLQQNYIAKQEMLFTRLVDDWLYQAKVRPQLSEKLGKHNEFHLEGHKGEADELVKTMMGPEIQDLWSDSFEQKLKDNAMVYNGVTLPWPRLFCIKPDITIGDKEQLAIERAAKPTNIEMESLGQNLSVEEDIKAIAENKSGPKPKNIFMAILEKCLLNSIQKIVTSTQTEGLNSYIVSDAEGKSTWQKTHFIFILDCSGSMKGKRWESVKIGYEIFLRRVKPMKDILISAFSFDTRVNPFCNERDVDSAYKTYSMIPFTGKGTNYRRALDYATSLMTKSKYDDYLVCMLFLSDGLGGYPVNEVETLQDLRNEGRKFIFYSIACDTDENEDADMIKLATDLGGEHYKIVEPEAAVFVFSAIIKV